MCIRDRLAEKAESSRSRDMSILVKSNAMRKACKEKIAEMTELDQQMADKLLELKNCELVLIVKPTDSGNSCCQSLTLLLSTPDFYCFTWFFMSTICFYH